MTAPLNLDRTLQATPTGYADRPVTKPPNWHGLVTLDLIFNNLSTGLFLVTALGELVHPAAFRPLAPVAYPLALLFLIGDVVCLVLDLGDPSRFHHMLRVWKPRSPMSLGTWVLAAYGVALTALSVVSLLRWGAALEWVVDVLLVVGLLLAIGAAVYKGVLFSTTAQRGWGDARWLGGYLINSALALGAAEFLFLATALGQLQVVPSLRLAAVLLLLVNMLALVLLVRDVRIALLAARGPFSLGMAGLQALVAGIALPILLMLTAHDSPVVMGAALLLMLVGATAVRSELVQLPHRLAEVKPGLHEPAH
jgi:Ni/Fe-hydrogenase subunit HybB-like protein